MPRYVLATTAAALLLATTAAAQKPTHGKIAVFVMSATDSNGFVNPALADSANDLLGKLTTLPQHNPWRALPGMLRHAYTLGKAYRAAYPPAEPSADLERVLAVFPFPDQRNLPPELSSALEAASARQ